jgi:hypothetical protein
MKRDFIKKFNFVTNIFILISIMLASVVWADTNGIFLKAEDIVPGIFGEDQSGEDFKFKELNVEKLTIENQVCLNGVCVSNWEDLKNKLHN